MSRLRYEQCPECLRRGGDSRRDNLVRYSDGGAHCFACGHHEHPPWLGPPKTVLKEEYGSAGLPADFTREVDPAGWKWLLQWGLPYSYWQESVGYSPTTKRLVFPVPGTSPVFSIGRYIEEAGGGEAKEGRKEAPRKWYVWGNCHSHSEVLGNGDFSVLVEDLISAHKVAYTGLGEAIPLFGTVVHPSHIYSLRDGSKRPVVVWLDDDQRGLVAKKAARVGLLTNRPVFITHTKKDPKALSLKEIKETLYEVFA